MDPSDVLKNAFQEYENAKQMAIDCARSCDGRIEEIDELVDKVKDVLSYRSAGVVYLVLASVLSEVIADAPNPLIMMDAIRIMVGDMVEYINKQETKQ
jgi:hypothetical protein